MRAKTVNDKYDISYIKSNMDYIAEGTEGETYSDGLYAYKIILSSLVPSPEEIVERYAGKKL